MICPKRINKTIGLTSKVILFLFCISFSSHILAAEKGVSSPPIYEGEIFRNKDRKFHIEALTFANAKAPVLFSFSDSSSSTSSKDDPQAYVILEFRFDLPDWKLIIGKKNLSELPLEKGVHRVKVLLKNTLNSIQVTAIHSSGKKLSEKVWIRIPKINKAEIKKSLLLKKKKSIVTLSRPKKNEVKIDDLNFRLYELPIHLLPADEEIRPFVTISGDYRRPGWKLSIKMLDDNSGTNKSLFSQSSTPEGEFSFSTLVTNLKSSYLVTATSPEGEVKTETVELTAPEVKVIRLIKPSKWGTLLVSVGVSQFRYTQTAFGDYSAHTGIAHITYNTHRGFSPWGLQAEVESTLFSVSATPAGLSPQLILGNLNLTYRFNESPTDAFQIHFLSGINYATLLSNGSPFGFAHLITPEMGPKFTIATSQTSLLALQGKYIFLASNPLKIFTFNEQGVDLALSWSKQLMSFKTVSAGIRLAYYSYSPSTTTEIKFGLYSFQLGYSF